MFFKKRYSTEELGSAIYQVLRMTVNTERNGESIADSFMTELGEREDQLPKLYQAELTIGLLFSGWIAVRNEYDQESADRVLDAMLEEYLRNAPTFGLTRQRLTLMTQARFNEYEENIGSRSGSGPLGAFAKHYVANILGRERKSAMTLLDALAFLHGFNRAVHRIVHNTRVR